MITLSSCWISTACTLQSSRYAISRVDGMDTDELVPECLLCSRMVQQSEASTSVGHPRGVVAQVHASILNWEPALSSILKT